MDAFNRQLPNLLLSLQPVFAGAAASDCDLNRKHDKSIYYDHSLCQTWRLSSLKWWAATVWIKDTKGCLDGAAIDLFSENEIARESCNTHLWLLTPGFLLQPLRGIAQPVFRGAGDEVLRCQRIAAILVGEIQRLGDFSRRLVLHPLVSLAKASTIFSAAVLGS